MKRAAKPASPLLQWAIAGLAALALLWLVFSLWTAAQALAAVGVLALGGSAIVVYGTAQSVAWKYLFPGIAGMLVFVAFPLLYTVQIGFTNYSSSNLLQEDRARNYLLDQTVADEANARPFTLHAEGGALRLKLMPQDDSAGDVLVSPPLNLTAGAPKAPVEMQPLGATALAEPLSLKQLIPLRERRWRRWSCNCRPAKGKTANESATPACASSAPLIRCGKPVPAVP